LLGTVDFVATEYGEAAKEAWLNALEEEIQHAHRYPLASSWYPLKTYWKAGVAACREFAPDSLTEAVRKWGAHGAQVQLTGIYRIFLKVGSPNMMFRLAAKIWKIYYSEGTMVIPVNEKGHVVAQLRDFSIQDPLWGESCAGWIARAVQLTGKKNTQVTVTQTPRGDEGFFEFSISWV
jgi:hypothetical protein